MLVRFFSHGKGSACAAVEYLVGERDAAGQEREGVEVLRGNPDMVAAVADSLDFERRYTSAVIAWAPEDRPTGERGELQDSVFRRLGAEEQREIVAWPDGERFFKHLQDLPGPLRVADFPDHLRSLGLSPTPLRLMTIQATPMHHRAEHLGSFFLTDKEDGEPFTSADEDILVLFASQAALAVERERADMAALIETSPVGVVVFDAGTGDPVSLNREARRIVESLRTPGRPTEQLLEVTTCRHPEGLEVSFEEFPLAQQLGSAETIGAEQVEVSVPDRRSIQTFINATPNRSDEEEIVSVVVTLKDLAPFEELERQRVDFLGMVSHELRAPLTSIKGSASTVLDAEPLPSQAEMVQFFRIIGGQADHMRGLIADLLDAGSIEAGTLTVQPESSEAAALVERARNTFVSGGGRQPVLIDLPPDLPPDLPRAMADRERIVQVLNNLLSNAGRHSPPNSPIRVEAEREGGYVAVSVSDQGRGIPPDRLGHLFRKRVRPAEGTGLGLAICKGLVEAHGGRIRAESAGTGGGARFTFTLPLAGEPEPEAAGPLAPADRAHRGRILVVDDDPGTLRYVRDILSDAGYAPVATGEPGEIRAIILAERPRLVLLDLILPGTDGIELMKDLPELGDLPVIFISAYGRDETIARALESGAADYIVKPFSPTELVARVQAALRARPRRMTVMHGDLAVDHALRRVSVAGEDVRLTTTEFELLRVMSVAAGGIVTTEDLLRKVWGRRGAGDTDRVRTAVKKLRAKLGDSAADPAYIFNEHGVGYRIAIPGPMVSGGRVAAGARRPPGQR
ncbi:MAG: response regulator [Gammaproteobacteria bacterium]|nr:response regulator [Gammaproteobacteria bacterium]